MKDYTPLCARRPEEQLYTLLHLGVRRNLLSEPPRYSEKENSECVGFETQSVHSALSRGRRIDNMDWVFKAIPKSQNSVAPKRINSTSCAKTRRELALAGSALSYILGHQLKKGASLSQYASVYSFYTNLVHDINTRASEKEHAISILPISSFINLAHSFVDGTGRNVECTECGLDWYMNTETHTNASNTCPYCSSHRYIN